MRINLKELEKAGFITHYDESKQIVEIYGETPSVELERLLLDRYGLERMYVYDLCEQVAEAQIVSAIKRTGAYQE